MDMENLTPAKLTDMGICPTCYDKSHNNCLYGDCSNKILFENKIFECLLVGNPRADGHTIISTKKHYKDMMGIPDGVCSEIFTFAKKMMNILKKVYNAESVYLCTMCDGPMNHFHLQLIPRYDFEQRGSKNFVKPRKEYVHNQEKIDEIKRLLNIKIRKATVHDGKELSYVKKAVWETTYRGLYPDEKFDNYDYEKNELMFQTIVNETDKELYVATDNDTIIGYIECGVPIRPFGDYKQEIGMFYLKKEYQKLGIGRDLFNTAFDYINNTGVDKFFISCHKYNENAKKFYEKMGGKIVHTDEDSANDNVPQVKFEYII